MDFDFNEIVQKQSSRAGDAYDGIYVGKAGISSSSQSSLRFEGYGYAIAKCDRKNNAILLEIFKNQNDSSFKISFQKDKNGIIKGANMNIKKTNMPKGRYKFVKEQEMQGDSKGLIFVMES